MSLEPSPTLTGTIDAGAISQGLGVFVMRVVSWKIIADAMTNAFETGGFASPWLNKVRPTGNEDAPPLWYAEPGFWANLGLSVTFWHEDPDGEEDSEKETIVNHQALLHGLTAMSLHDARHFAELLDESGDAYTYDSLLQHILFGKAVYG